MDQAGRRHRRRECAALAAEAVAETARGRADAGDRHHAEREAGDEDAEAAQAAAQVAQARRRRIQADGRRAGFRRRTKV
jgi:hypothetical protein